MNCERVEPARRISIKILEQYVDMESTEYRSWDKGDCSLPGLLKLLLIQELEILCRDPWCDGNHETLYKLLTCNQGQIWLTYQRSQEAAKEESES